MSCLQSSPTVLDRCVNVYCVLTYNSRLSERHHDSQVTAPFTTQLTNGPRLVVTDMAWCSQKNM